MGDNAKQPIDAVRDDFARAVEASPPRLELAPYLGRVDPTDRRKLLEALVATALERLGEEGPDQLLAANETLADELGPLLSRAVETLRHVDSGPPVEQGLHVRCPHCAAPIELVADAELESVHCPSCGSDFGLVDDEDTATKHAPGVTTIAHFNLVERVGMGAFGAVWKAHDANLDRTVAVKIPRRGQLDSRQQKILLREAQNAAQLSHPGVVPVYEVGREGDTLYIVSEFVRGLTLGDWLTGQQPTAREAAETCQKIAVALQHAHERGVVHRDLKPDNVMLQEQPDGALEPRLMDFGLARREAAEITMTTDGQILGTPAYMAPEQARGESHQADARADVYSLGVMLFELLTGERPFRGNQRMLLHQVIHDEPPSPRKLNASVPRDLETVTLKCLEKDPARRYQAAGDVGDELGRWLEGHSIQARPTPTPVRAYRWCRRNPWPAATFGLIAVALTAGAVGGLAYAAQQARQSAELAEALAMAEEQRAEAIDAKKGAEASAKVAAARTAEAVERTKEAERAQREIEAVLDYFEGAFVGIESVDGWRTDDLSDFLQSAANAIDKRLADQPSVAARCWVFIGRAIGASDGNSGYDESSVSSLDAFDKAISIYLDLGAAVDSPDLLRAQSLKLRGNIDYMGNHELTPAEFELLAEVYDKQCEGLGRSHHDSIETLSFLATAAIARSPVYSPAGIPKPKNRAEIIAPRLKYVREFAAHEAAEHGESSSEALSIERVLLTHLIKAEELEEAIAVAGASHLRHAQKFGPYHGDSMEVLHHHATALEKAGRSRDATALYDDLVETLRENDELRTRAGCYALREVLRWHGTTGDADRAIETMELVAEALQELGNWRELPLSKRNSWSSVFPSGNDDVFRSSRLCSSIARRAGQAASRRVLEKAASLYARFRPTDPAGALSWYQLGEQLFDEESYKDSVSPLQRASALLRPAVEAVLEERLAITERRKLVGGSFADRLHDDSTDKNQSLLRTHWDIRCLLGISSAASGDYQTGVRLLTELDDELKTLADMEPKRQPHEGISRTAAYRTNVRCAMVSAAALAGERDDAVRHWREQVRDWLMPRLWGYDYALRTGGGYFPYREGGGYTFGRTVDPVIDLIGEDAFSTSVAEALESIDIERFGLRRTLLRVEHLARVLRTVDHYPAAVSASAALLAQVSRRYADHTRFDAHPWHGPCGERLMCCELMMVHGNAARAIDLLQPVCDEISTWLTETNEPWNETSETLPCNKAGVTFPILNAAILAHLMADDLDGARRSIDAAARLAEARNDIGSLGVGVFKLMTRQIGEREFLRLREEHQSHEPEFWFYAAEVRRHHGDREGAIDAYRQSVRAGASERCEMRKAVWSAIRLKQMGETWSLDSDEEVENKANEPKDNATDVSGTRAEEDRD